MTTKQKKPGWAKSLVQDWARWAGIPVDAGDGAAWNLADRIGTAQNVASQTVNEATALKLSAVWACVTLLSDTIGALPLGFYEKRTDGRMPAVDHPLYRILRRQPNALMNSSQFLGATIANMLLRGMGYWEKQIGGGGRVIGLSFLPTARMAVTVLPTGEEQYRYTHKGITRLIPIDRLVKIPAFGLDGEHGISAIWAGANVFGAAQAAEQAAGGTFSRGLLPTTYFKYPTTLKADQRADARVTIKAISGAVNSGEPVILEAGMEAGQLGISPSDAQLLESRAFSVEEICSWFRVQPFMIGRASQGQTNWGTGIEQQMIGFITFTLQPWLRRIEQAIETNLLLPEEHGRYYAEFNLEGLLRGDSAARKEFYASALQNGWMNRNQVRALENMEPIEGGDVFTVQSNLMPILQVGTAPPVTAPALPQKSDVINFNVPTQKPRGMRIVRDLDGNITVNPTEET